MVDKLKDTTPRPRIGKTAKDTRMARLIDINKVVDEVNYELLVVDGEQAIQDMRLALLEADVAALPVSPTTIEVDISSAEILTMGATPIELLPAPGVGMYYEWEAVLEFTHLTTPYTLAGDAIYVGNSGSYNGSGIHEQFIQRGYSTFAFASNKNVADHVALGTGLSVNVDGALNEAVSIFTWNSTNPTLGDGTLKVYITYTTKIHNAYVV